MSVHYKFKNTINYENVKFDGVYITCADLKSRIAQQKRLGSELQIENEDTGQIYSDDASIPKNTNIIVSRLPCPTKKPRLDRTSSKPYSNPRFNSTSNSHHHHNHHQQHYNNHNPSSSSTSAAATSAAASATELLSTKSMSEEEKIKCIQMQSTQDFETTRYPRRGGGRGPPGPGYVCRKCGTPGHSIYDCKTSMHKVKRSSGIPRDFLVKVDSNEKGALMTPTGEYAVPYIDREAYSKPKVEKAPFFED